VTGSEGAVGRTGEWRFGKYDGKQVWGQHGENENTGGMKTVGAGDGKNSG
jgi:hypothetical protein